MNKELFERIYSAYFKKLGRYACVILKDKELAEEAVQQVFFKIWEQRESLQIKKIYPYLIRSTKNEALQLLKRENVTAQSFQIDYEEIKSADLGESNEDSLNQIKKAIQFLPPKCKEIMILKMDDGLTHKEISEYLNISIKTIENQVSIAFKKLREMIKK